MARTTPQIVNDLLTDYAGAESIAVGSPAWFAWLEQSTGFSFRGPTGVFTARREARERGDGYWRAYRTVDGRQRRAYLGRSADLTPERLRAVAARLGADSPARPASASGPGTPDSSDTASSPPIASIPPTLLSTKLYMPRPRSAIVQRPRLLARLDAGLLGPLTLIAAPAGFGKTTLLADWLATRTEERGLTTESGALSLSPQSSFLSTRVAWLSLDPVDNDPAIFLRYLIAALRMGTSAAVGAMALALMPAPEPPPPPTLLTTLVNDLAALPPSARAARPYVIVLDDYHVIASLAVHSALTFLLEHLPPTLHLVIASREDPPLPLARLRARAEVSELRAAELRFTPEEAAAFLRDVMELDITAGEVAALEDRTEGWIAGLQLAALTMRDRSDRAGFIAAFSGSNRFVVDYLASEVIDRLPDHLRTFVLQTAILGRMCGPLCDAVLGVGDWVMGDGDEAPSSNPQPPTPNPQAYSQLMLEELERANLFLVPLDDQRRWYRYHQLFAEVLREHLLRSLAAADVARLHRRASAWLERHGLAPEAIQHALLANDFDGAAGLIEHVALPMALDGQHVTVGAWLAELPAAMYGERPRLALAQAYIAGSNGDYAAAEAQLRQAEAGVEGWDEVEAAAVRGEVAALRALALSMLGDARAADLGRMALAQLPERHPLRGVIVSG